MNQTSTVFDLDPTVWCVNSFNILSYPHTSKDATVLYRGNKNPTIGWMMPRRIIEEFLPHWPSASEVRITMMLSFQETFDHIRKDMA